MTLQEILSTVVPTQRLLYTAKDKPSTYCTFQRISASAAQSADDEVLAIGETYRVTLFSKTDYEDVLDAILKALKANGYYVNSIDGENYETDTGYYMCPVTIQHLKE